MGSLPILSFVYVLAKSEECPAAEASLHMLTVYHQCNRPILLVWGRRTGADLGLPSCGILWGCAGSLGEAFETSTVVLPMWQQIDLLAKQSGENEKKLLLSPIQHATLLGPWPRYFKMMAILETATWMGALPCSILVVHSQLPWAIWLFY